MISVTVRHDGSVKDYLLKFVLIFFFFFWGGVQCVELEHWTDKIKVYHRQRDLPRKDLKGQQQNLDQNYFEGNTDTLQNFNQMEHGRIVIALGLTEPESESLSTDWKWTPRVRVRVARRLVKRLYLL